MKKFLFKKLFSKKLKLCVVTGSRAEYGIMKGLIGKISRDGTFMLQLVVTGSHLSKAHGHTYKEIKKDGFRITKKINLRLGDDSPRGIARAMARATAGFGAVYRNLKPDMVLVFGDRYEILAAAQAALFAQIPVAEIGGGDTTEGAFDEAMRHSITKMAHLHFVTNAESATRVRQLGEDPEKIFTVGTPAIDAIRELKLPSRSEIEKKIDFKLRKKNLLITFHPATLEKESPAAQFKELLAALSELDGDVGLIFTKPNADTGNREITKLIEHFVKDRKNAAAYDSLGQFLYLGLLREVDAVVGNSSSGLYEAPSFGKPTVNVGDRQKGRLKASSVIDCVAQKAAIANAIHKAFSSDASSTINPYGDGYASERILEELKKISDPKALLKKHFFQYPQKIKESSIFIIAEAGVNHNGSLERAKELIDRAAEAGADAVKFQSFKAENVVSKLAQKADYQIKATGEAESQLEMIKKLELSPEAHRELAIHCQRKNIEFMSTPFDIESVDLLKSLGVRRLKLPSGEITNPLLILKIARTGLPLIASTGMSDLKEVEKFLGVLAFGYTRFGSEKPGEKEFQKAFGSSEGKRALSEKVTLLHCTTEYPTPYEDVNLRAMETLRSTFNLPVGLSDHTEGIASVIAAVALGARVIEKHFTLNRNLPGPDHKASLEPAELQSMVRSVRQVEKALGKAEKAPAVSEIKNIVIARRSLVAACPISKGEFFSESNLTVKRPGNGTSPFAYWDWLGKKSEKNYEADEVIA